MLQKQNFFISLAKGLSTKEDPKQVIPGRLLVLENAVFIAPNELQKRNGYQTLNLFTENNLTVNDFNTIPVSLNSGNFLAAFNQEIVLNDNFNLYSYSYGLGAWIYKDPSTICNVTTTPIIRNTNSQTIPDSAINPMGLQIFAWEDSSDSNVHVSILDTQTNQIIIADHIISPSGGGNTLKPKCAFLNGNLIVFYLDSTVNMHLNFITYSAGVFSSPTVVSSLVNVINNNYDVVVNQTNLYITYNTSANSITTLLYIGNLTAFGSFTEAGENANNCITIFPDVPGNVWIAYANSTQVKLFILNSDLSIVVHAPSILNTVSNIYNITGVGDTGFSSIFVDIKESADTNGNFSNAQTFFYKVLINGSTPYENMFLRSAALETKAFSILQDGVLVPHVILSHDAALQPTYFLCNLYNVNSSSALPLANVAAKIAASLGGGLPAKKSSLSSVNLVSTGIVSTTLLQKDLLFTSASPTGTVNTYSQTGIISPLIDFTQKNLNTTVLGNNLHIGSGMLGMYDGSTVVEHNFHLYPEAITAVLNNSGGHLTDSSSYGYQVTYEWTDNQGQLHRSSPSPVLSVTTATPGNISQVVLTIPTLRITDKSKVIIVIYRTQANGTVYFRLNAPTSPLYNSTTSDSVTYTDNAADSSIGANEQLYTTGGEVPNIAAPGSSIMGEYKNRVILIPSDNPFSWWFSKQVIPGSPVEFSDVFVENIGTDGGPITAFLQMDSNAIFFKENSIFYVVGDGPSPSGANNDFSQALSIASDVGCINAQSLVLMPLGIIFKSNKGIYLLSRGMAVEYIGADVEAFNSASVTSAQLISYTNQIRFTLNSGVALVYDYYVGQWSVFTNINAVSSIIASDIFTYLQPGGRTLQESQGQFTDNGSPIVLKLTTSWLSLSGIQGYQRIYKALILGQYFGPHQLLIEFAYDFNPTLTQQTYINATQNLNSPIFGGDPAFGMNSPYGGNFPTYQWRIFTERQVCQAIQITLQDVPFAGTYVNTQGTTIPTTYNESLSLSAISLELGMKKGLNKLPGNRSFS